MNSKKPNTTRKNKIKVSSFDYPLLIITILLLAFGFIAVLSASYPIGTKDFSDGYYYAKKHVMFLVLGFIAMFIGVVMPRKFLKRFTPLIFAATMVMVMLLWSPLADSSYGQARWIKLPGVPFKIQPSDFVKVSSVLFIAKILESNRRRMEKPSVFFVLVAILGISVLPIMSRDLSTGLVIGLSITAMFLVGGMKIYQFVILFALGMIGSGVLVFGSSYRRKRVMSFLKGDKTKKADDVYQITQALYAIAMGGTGGVGLFHSRQKYTNLPFAYNDFIFAIICEEFGAIGGSILIILFILFVYRGFTIAYRATNYFDKYTAVGLTTFIGIQAIFNLGVSTKLFPVTGITLPFISYGGTALIVSMASVGLLLRISRDA